MIAPSKQAIARLRALTDERIKADPHLTLIEAAESAAMIELDRISAVARRFEAALQFARADLVAEVRTLILPTDDDGFAHAIDDALMQAPFGTGEALAALLKEALAERGLEIRKVAA